MLANILAIISFCLLVGSGAACALAIIFASGDTTSPSPLRLCPLHCLHPLQPFLRDFCVPKCSKEPSTIIWPLKTMVSLLRIVLQAFCAQQPWIKPRVLQNARTTLQLSSCNPAWWQRAALPRCSSPQARMQSCLQYHLSANPLHPPQEGTLGRQCCSCDVLWQRQGAGFPPRYSRCQLHSFACRSSSSALGACTPSEFEWVEGGRTHQDGIKRKGFESMFGVLIKTINQGNQVNDIPPHQGLSIAWIPLISLL